MSTPGPLALVGGEELQPGNEAVDRLLVEAANRLEGNRPAFVVATAAARQDPDRAVANAVRWFGALGLALEELPLRRRGQATSTTIARLARTGRFFYLVGGDPGLTVSVLRESAAWEAIAGAWREDGAVLAGSSAGAMAFGEWTLLRQRMPGDARRRPSPALGLVPRVAVIPHFDRFGERWIESAADALPPDAILLGIPERSAALWTPADRWRSIGPGQVSVHGTAPGLSDRSDLADLADPA